MALPWFGQPDRRGAAKRFGLALLAALVIAASLVIGIGAASPTPIRAAFAYEWFPQVWADGSHYHPALGQYDSSNPTILASHIEAMRWAGIQAGIFSWWGQGTPTDSRFPAILAAAAGKSFGVTAYYEPEGQGDPSSAQIGGDLAYLARYAADPSWLRVAGRPVLFVYGTGSDVCSMADRWAGAPGRANWYVVLKVFAGYLSCANQPDSWHQYGPAVRTDRQGSFSFSISPGFWKSTESTPRLARDLTAWNTAVCQMVASGTQWQLITTFNEWSEGTAVEPTREFPGGLVTPSIAAPLAAAAMSGGGETPARSAAAGTQTSSTSPLGRVGSPIATGQVAASFGGPSQPSLTTQQPGDMALADAVLAREGGLLPVRSGVARTDSGDLLVGQLGVAVPLAAMTLSGSGSSHAPAPQLVRDVGLGAAQQQVAGSDAGGVVAAVQNGHALGDGAVGQFPREAMGADIQAVSPEVSVTGPDPGAAPFPASVVGGNKTPEPLGDVHAPNVTTPEWGDATQTGWQSGSGYGTYLDTLRSPSCSPSPSPSASATASPTTTSTPSTTPGSTGSPTPPPSATPTVAPSPSPTAMATGAPSPSSTPTPTPSAGGSISHVVIVWLENHEASSVTASSMPYLTGLANTYGLATNYDAVSHPSLPNYLAWWSGSTQGVTDDGTYNFSRPSLSSQFAAAGLSWRTYAQNYPASGCNTGSSYSGGVDGYGVGGTYARKHDPAMSFTSVSGSATQCANIQPLARFDPSVNLAFVVPNLCNDAHDCSLTTADNFLKAFSPQVFNSADWAHTLYIVTFDEGTSGTGGGGHVYTMVARAALSHFSSSTLHNHYGLTRTVEDIFGLLCLNSACSAAPMSEFIP